MIRVSPGVGDRPIIEIDMPRTDTIMAGGDVLLAAQALVTASLTAPEMDDDTVTQVNFHHWIGLGDDGGPDFYVEPYLTTRELAAPGNFVAMAVAQHFGLEASAQAHAERLQETTFAQATEKGEQRDLALIDTSDRTILHDPSPEGFALARVLSEEIDNPYLSWQAFDHLYSHGDSESFDPLMRQLELLIQEVLATDSASFLLSTLPNVVQFLEEFGGEVIGAEHGRAMQTGSNELLRRRHTRVQDLYRTVKRKSEELAQDDMTGRPPQHVQDFLGIITP